MKHAFYISALVLALSSSAASAATCVAEYKAKRDNPLRLDHGSVIVQAQACTEQAVEQALRAQLRENGWTLLSILSVKQSG